MLRVSSMVRRGVLVGALALASAACGGPLRYSVRGTPRAAGADADVEAHVNRGQSNTRLEVRATNLPPPDRVAAGSTMFVVWQRRNASSQWSRVGTLEFNPGSRVGELHGVTVPETSFELQITAEMNATPGSPSQNVVFDQQVGSGS